MLRNERYDFILNHFRNALPNVTTELQFGSAFQLLVATLLSAQCTDKRINMVTLALCPLSRCTAHGEGERGGYL